MRPSPRTGLAVLASLASGLLASCTSFAFEGQRVLARHDVVHDELHLVLTYEDVHPPGESARLADEAHAAVADVLAGRRLFVLGGWPFEFDLDDPAFETSDDDPLGREVTDFLVDNVAVVEAGFFRNEADVPGVFQHVRVTNASVGVALLNAVWNAAILQAEEGALANDFSPLDERTVRLWREHARARGRWFSLGDGGIELAFPMTPASAARGLAALVDEAARAGEERTPPFFDSLTAVELADERLVLRFAPDRDGILAIAVRPVPTVGEVSLLEELRAETGREERGWEGLRALLLAAGRDRAQDEALEAAPQ